MRPCPVLSTNIVSEWRVVAVLPSISPTPDPAPLIPIGCSGRKIVAVTDQILAITREQLQGHLAEVSPAVPAAVETGVRGVLELR